MVVFPLLTVIAVEVLLHIVLFGDVMTSVGSTVTVLDTGVPAQAVAPGPVGVIV